MPEGDTLWRTAAALRERIAGRILLDIKPTTFNRLQGRRVTAVDANGKHLFIRFDSGLSLHSHMRMRGAWHVYRPGERFRAAERDIKAILTFDEWLAVLFAAPIVEIVAGDDRTAHLGPDILAEPFDLETVVANAISQAQRPIAEVLLDQRVCAGIGNIYRCESLWLLRVSPWRPIGEIEEPVIRKLYETARRLMLDSALGRMAPRPRAVHGRGGRPCPRCAQLIQVKNHGSPPRLMYWCTKCQQ